MFILLYPIFAIPIELQKSTQNRYTDSWFTAMLRSLLSFYRDVLPIEPVHIDLLVPGNINSNCDNYTCERNLYDSDKNKIHEKS